MSTLLSIDVIATLRRLVLEPPMTDAKLFAFCVQNEILCVERTMKGVIELNPAGSYSSSANPAMLYQLFGWPK